MSERVGDISVESAFDDGALALFGDEAHAIRVGRFLLRHGPELAGWPVQSVPDSRPDAASR